MSNRLEALRKREIKKLIINSIGSFIMALMLFIAALFFKDRSDDNVDFLVFIFGAIFIIAIMIINIIYAYHKFLKKD